MVNSKRLIASAKGRRVLQQAMDARLADAQRAGHELEDAVMGAGQDSSSTDTDTDSAISRQPESESANLIRKTATRLAVITNGLVEDEMA
eukprot:CAMPEP_0117665044 /NCGR_PEP_ID=MMETSP0804-20121206/9582_1 /TAXON_ID=1074897 /ORGANISM="Tetraselmis astigmatica, Strain CCMP880" /LENGTH=89 /DNA_ID=CAMNT_0005472395 /DNA_START=888 /DNA_END=1154 /DNA_ORIENTATION=-